MSETETNPEEPSTHSHLATRILSWLRYLSEDPHQWQLLVPSLRAVFATGKSSSIEDDGEIILLDDDVVFDVISLMDSTGRDCEKDDVFLNTNFPMKGCKFTSSLVAAFVCHQACFRRATAFNSYTFSSSQEIRSVNSRESADVVRQRVQKEILRRRRFCRSKAERKHFGFSENEAVDIMSAMMRKSQRMGDLSRHMDQLTGDLYFTRHDGKNYRHPNLLRSQTLLLESFEEQVRALKSGDLKEGVAILVRLHDLVALRMNAEYHKDANISHHFTIFLAFDVGEDEAEQEEAEEEGESQETPVVGVIRGFIAQSLSPFGCLVDDEVARVDTWDELRETGVNEGRGFSICYDLNHHSSILSESEIRQWIIKFCEFCQEKRFDAGTYEELFHARFARRATPRNFHVSVSCRVLGLSESSFDLWQNFLWKVKACLRKCRSCRTADISEDELTLESFWGSRHSESLLRRHRAFIADGKTYKLLAETHKMCPVCRTNPRNIEKVNQEVGMYGVDHPENDPRDRQMTHSLLSRMGDSTVRSCGYCGRIGPANKRCARCKIVYYCNPKCQRSDWKRHKKRCIRRSDS